MPSIAEIRAKLQALENKSSINIVQDNLNFPFWNTPEGKTSRLRFLPDADQENTFFWRERQQIRIPFPGMVDDPTKQTTIVVPCVEMWGEKCPVHEEIRPWFKDPALEDTARTYWKKRAYIFQGFVQENGVPDDDAPENPIRKFVIGNQIFKLIKSSLLDPDFEYSPTDYVNGTDFIISKTVKGGYADYTTSKWARKESALTGDQLAAIEEHKLVDLNEYLPKRPTPEQLNAIYEMFEASVDGQLYDPAKWAQYYKPYGYEYKGDSADRASTPPPAKEEKVESKAEPEEAKVEETVSESTSSTQGKSAQEILDMIRARK